MMRLSSVLTLMFLALAGPGVRAQVVDPTPPEVNDSKRSVPVKRFARINVSVWSPKKESFVTDLSYRDFQVGDNDGAQNIDYFIQKDEPLDVGILFDSSGSMQNPRSRKDNEIAIGVDGLKLFVEKSNQKNRYFVIRFDKTAEQVLDLTSDRLMIQNALSRVSTVDPRGNTSFFDSIDAGLAKFADSDEGKKVLLVVSDGKDNNSRTARYELIRGKLRSSRIPLYIINFVRPDEAQQVSIDDSEDKLQSLAKMNGGRVFYVKSKAELFLAFEMLANELRSQYTIGFTPKYFESGTWRKLKITLSGERSRDKNMVLAPTGYSF